MPEWLLKKDEYTPQRDKNAFINKSILSLFHVLTMFRRQTQYRKNIFGVNTLTKFISTFIIIVFMSMSQSLIFVLTVNVLMLVIINFLGINEIKYVIKASVIPVIFTILVLLPAILLGHGNNFILITFKVLVSITFVNILACTTEWHDLIRTLKVFHIPDMFIFVLDITIKYIIVLGEFSLNMVYALKLRSVGKSRGKDTSLAGIIGTMFIKSKEMAEDMYSAMECRGFSGEYIVYSKNKFKIADFFCIIFIAVFILTYFYFDRL